MSNALLTPADITDRVTAILMDRDTFTPWQDPPIRLERIEWSEDREAITLHLTNKQRFYLRPLTVFPVGTESESDA